MVTTMDRGHELVRKVVKWHTERGFKVLHKEHSYKAGYIYKTCNVGGFDILFLSADNLYLKSVEVTTTEHYSEHTARLSDMADMMTMAGIRCEIWAYVGRKTASKQSRIRFNRYEFNIIMGWEKIGEER